MEEKTPWIEPKHLIWLAGLVCLWVIMASLLPADYSLKEGTSTVSIKATANSQTILEKTIEVKNGTNAFEAVQEDANFGYTDYGEMGVFVESIEGVTPRPNEFWKLFVNGEEAQTGISAIVIQEDTAIEWRTETIEGYSG